MIDRLEEVLRGVRPEEENRLLELLRQGGVVRVAAAEDVEESAGQERADGTSHPAAVDFPELDPVGDGEWAGVQAKTMPEESLARFTANDPAAVLTALARRAMGQTRLRAKGTAQNGGILTVEAGQDSGDAVIRSLYRRTAEAVRDAAAARTENRAVVIREAPETGSGLTVRELDIAVRRDSRRYDGAMNIY